MFTHIETESVTETENSQSEISTDYTTRNVKEVLQTEEKWYQVKRQIYTKGWWALEKVTFFSIYFSFKIINCFKKNNTLWGLQHAQVKYMKTIIA